MADEPEVTTHPASSETTPQGETVEVEVTVPAQDPPPEPEPEHTTVVVAGTDSGIHPDVAAFMAETREALTGLSRDTQDAHTRAGAAEATASGAAEAVEGAVAEVQEIADQTAAAAAATQAPPPSPEQDVSPHKPHLWFRKSGGGRR